MLGVSGRSRFGVGLVRGFFTPDFGHSDSMRCFVCGDFGHVRQTCPNRDCGSGCECGEQREGGVIGKRHDGFRACLWSAASGESETVAAGNIDSAHPMEPDKLVGVGESRDSQASVGLSQVDVDQLSEGAKDCTVVRVLPDADYWMTLLKGTGVLLQSFTT
ncbi:DNA nucleotidylexotransferase-like protein [Labeo rohita]|uniref:DNA nucleotidylexotransferase-like protein n=1 Tax=Labeo rohita TaxID=84645 RepID=A0A498P2X4_LABRO|nr:DNA nucleotidylexotransferase-like protein [Labeo rohita]